MSQENPSFDDIFGNQPSRQAQFGDYIARLGGGITDSYRRFVINSRAIPTIATLLERTAPLFRDGNFPKGDAPEKPEANPGTSSDDK
jgi:hypothetical protein